MHSIDIFIQNYFSATRTSSVTEFMYILTNFFDLSLHSVLITLCTAVLVYLVKNIRYALFFLFSILLGSIAVYFLKSYFDVARPAGGVMYVLGQSFPSYHATISTIYFILLMYIFDDYLSPLGRVIFNTLSVAVILVVAFSRIYLGVHWFSDVFFGIALGIFISYLCIVCFNFVMDRRANTSMLK